MSFKTSLPPRLLLKKVFQTWEEILAHRRGPRRRRRRGREGKKTPLKTLIRFHENCSFRRSRLQIDLYKQGNAEAVMRRLYFLHHPRGARHDLPISPGKPGLLFQLAQCAFFKCLVGFQPSPRQGPLVMTLFRLSSPHEHEPVAHRHDSNANRHFIRHTFRRWGWGLGWNAPSQQKCDENRAASGEDDGGD